MRGKWKSREASSAQLVETLAYHGCRNPCNPNTNRNLVAAARRLTESYEGCMGSAEIWFHLRTVPISRRCALRSRWKWESQ